MGENIFLPSLKMKHSTVCQLMFKYSVQQTYKLLNSTLATSSGVCVEYNEHVLSY